MKAPGRILHAVLGGMALAVLYRVAPSHRSGGASWTAGAVFAAIAWVVVTAGFSVYVSSFGKFNETCGALGGVIVTLTWFYLSGFIVLIGAELNAARAESSTA